MFLVDETSNITIDEKDFSLLTLSIIQYGTPVRKKGESG